MPVSPRVILYGRFSDERQNPSSARDQIAACEARAGREGWHVVDRFSDEAISGAVKLRPGYQALRHAVVDGKADIVMAEALDRLSRDQEETANLFKLCLFHEVKIFTLSEGIVTELHVGLSSTINAVFLKQLAEKTKRGLASKVESGKSAGGRAYGYRVPTAPNGLPMTGELEIHPDEAQTVRRILSDYARGMSPAKIAAALNQEGVPAPNGKDRGDGNWRANTIHGNRHRGTGILNNELYVGRRIWNRQRFVRKPGSKQRISRLNPENEWKVLEVPHLRIVDEGIWRQVKARQAMLDEIRLDNQVEGKAPLSGSQAARRPAYLLSGLIRCGCCGGPMNVGGSNPKRYYCASAREKGKAVCAGIPGIAKDKLERTVLDGIRTQLMQPGAIAEFMEEYSRQFAQLTDDRSARRKQAEAALRKTEKEIANILTAIKAGIFTESTKAELEGLEARKKMQAIEVEAANAEPAALPPDLAEVYRGKVEALVASLNAPETALEAKDAVRALLDRIVVHWDADAKSHAVEIEGELAALLALGTNKNAVSLGETACSLKLVAGTGFEPATFRL